MRLFALVFVAALASTTQAHASSGEANNCIFTVEGTSYLDGGCAFSDDGTHVDIKPTDSTTDKHRVRVQRRPDGSATGWWNGPQAQIATNIDLGQLERRGHTCWANARARICFTPIPAPSAAVVSSWDDELAAEIAEEVAGDEEEYRRSQMDQGGNSVDFGSAIDGMADAQSLTCVFAEEELYAPEQRVMLRGYGGRRYTGDIPLGRDFIFDGNESLTLNGNPHKVIWRDADRIAVRAAPEVSVSSKMPGLSNQQADDLQHGINLMMQLSGQATGLDQRVIVLNFADRTGVVVTLAGDTLTQHQPLRCQ